VVRRWLALAVVLGAALLASAAAPARAATGDFRIRQVDTSGYPNVAITVSVPGHLSADSLQVTEDGKPAPIVTVRPLATGDQTFDVVLAIDTSDSVRGAPLAAAVSAAEGFVQQLPVGVGVGVLTFDDNATVLQPVTDDHPLAVRSIATIGSTRHGTVLYDAVAAASKMFSGSAQRNILLLTDGSDVGSQSPLASAITAATTRHVAVYTVGLGANADAAVLRSLASETKGSFVPALESNLGAVYTSLARQLTNQYVVVFRSNAPGGAEVTIGVSAGGFSDRSFIQMPRLEAPPSPGFDFLHLFAGPVGFAAALGLAFLAVFALAAVLVGGSLRSRRDRRLASMMGAPSTEEGAERARDQSGPGAWIPDSFAQAAGRAAEISGVSSSLSRTLERAGVPMTPGELVAGSLLAALVAILFAVVVFHSALFAVLFAVIAGVLPFYLVRRRLNKRLQALADQLPDVLMILASSMRAGHSFMQALDAASREVGEPSGPEFARVVTEIRLGRPASEAMTALGERIGTEEYKWTVLAVNVQTEVGGNLAEILDTLAETVRERTVLRRQIRVLSAEGRLSMKIFVAVPPLLVLYISITNRAYMRVLWTTRAGWIMIAASIALMITGALLARKIVKIDV
jgi:tight adherence protein B